jgi:heat shock protein HslJ
VRDQRLVPVTAAGGVESPALAGTAWQWVHTRYNNDQRTIPARPEQYTLRFRDDGQIGVKADCNMKGGTYAATDKQLSMKIITSTMAVCPPGSLEEEFVRNLHAGTNYFFRDGDLFIDLKFDSGTMRFSPDGRH